MATFKITLVKATPWRAEALEEWSNSYHLSGTEPANAAEWVTLCEAIWAFEGRFIATGTVRTHLVHGYGYSPGSDVATWSGDFTAGGTTGGIVPAGGGYNAASFTPSPLQVAALFRWECGLSSHTGKPRYLMKYIHDVPANDAGPDGIGGLSADGTAALTAMTDGSLPFGSQMCAPDGTHATMGVLRPYYTTHQIKRRGKRPRRGA